MIALTSLMKVILVDVPLLIQKKSVMTFLFSGMKGMIGWTMIGILVIPAETLTKIPQIRLQVAIVVKLLNFTGGMNMIKITKKKQDAVRINEMKKGDTFLYNGKLYVIIEDIDRCKFLNLETCRVETGLHVSSAVPLVNCTLSYEMT